MIAWLRSWISPGFVTRRERTLYAAAFAVYTSVLASGAGLYFLAGHRSLMIAALLATLVGAFAARSALERAHLRALNRLRDAQFLLCPGCTFDLHASIDSQRCPECGRAFDLTSLRREWIHRYLRLLKRVQSGEHDWRTDSEGVDWWD